MTKIELLILLAVFLIVNVIHTVKATDTNDVLQQVNDKLSAAVDDLFIYLKININLTKPKNLEEFMSVHSYIQDELLKNHNIYKEIHETVKTNVSNEIADKIASVNDALNEMIREQTITKKEFHNFTKTYSTSNDDIVDLERVYNMKLATIIPDNITISAPNTSREMQGRRIFAGKDTGIKHYQFIVSVHVSQRFVCAGSLLHESLALSAASCVMRTQEDPTAQVQIRIGSDYVTKMGSLVHIDRIMYHPQFDQSTLANNLVFLKTKKALRFVQEKVVAIKYDKYDSVMLRGGKDIVILGWGRRKQSEKEKLADRPLSRTRLDVYDLEECKYIYTRDYVTGTNFCAGFADRGDGACNHDGGGPAIAGSLLTGVISLGSPQCGRSDAPTVFTRLSLYAEWIDSVLDEVKFPKGSEINPQTFHVPSSIEFGNGKSAEVNIEDIADENPQEVLKKEFGLLDVLSGPIDKGNKKLNRNTSGLHPEIDIQTSTLPSSRMVIQYPEVSVQSTVGPTESIFEPEEDISVVIETEEKEEQKEKDTDPNLTKNCNTTMETTTDMSTLLMAIYDDLFFQTASPTEPDEIETVTDETQREACDTSVTGKADSSGNSGKNDDSGYQTEDDSENVSGNGRNESLISDSNDVKHLGIETAIIVMEDSGTTKRIEVNKDSIMYRKAVKVMKALEKAVNANNRGIN